MYNTTAIRPIYLEQGTPQLTGHRLQPPSSEYYMCDLLVRLLVGLPDGVEHSVQQISVGRHTCIWQDTMQKKKKGGNAVAIRDRLLGLTGMSKWGQSGLDLM